jgi:hypothetical protein
MIFGVDDAEVAAITALAAESAEPAEYLADFDISFATRR